MKKVENIEWAGHCAECFTCGAFAPNMKEFHKQIDKGHWSKRPLAVNNMRISQQYMHNCAKAKEDNR
ncbi:MAG TPA: hypothetical protein VGN87_06230 [Paenibacillus sp.]|jgi:hypothetical protein